ncbi:hypothetical protein [Thermocrinis sp.]|jgi:hypothetical protein|uniref:hypothetical protein n=1 Tax=Thermocrinis sp. TaxID=2024383 RepID=UPI003C0D9DEB
MDLVRYLKRLFRSEKVNLADLPKARVSVQAEKVLTPKTLDVRYKFVNPKYPREWLNVIAKAVVANPILSQVHNLTINLANTGHTVQVEGKDAEKAREELKELAFLLNTDHLINQLIAQINISGAISAEVVVDEKLQGVKKVVFVPASTVYFVYNEETDEYEPYQWVGNAEPIKLNTATYKYLPLLTLEDSPYAIPPFLASLSIVEVVENMIAELKGLAQKIGLIGFLDVKFPPLAKAPNETETEYQERALRWLENIAQQISENMAKGIFLHFDGTEAEFKEISPNAGGIREIIDLAEKWLIEGAKSQPAVLGFSTGYTETWATVALHVFSAQLQNIQRLVRRFLEFTYRLHLMLRGFDIDDVNIIFNPLPDFEPQKKAEARLKEVQRIVQLLQAGIIDIETAKKELGYGPEE